MSRLTKILLAVMILLIIAAGVVGFMLWQKTQQTPVDAPQGASDSMTQPTNQDTTGALPQQPTGSGQQDTMSQPPLQEPPVITPRDPAEVSLEQTAANYAEIFGTNSTQSNYANFTTLLPLSTVRMQSWLQQMIDKNATSDIAGLEYKGVRTRALKSTIEKQAGTSATVTVRTQRIEEAEGMEPKIYQQEIQLELRKVNSQWLVEGAFWGEIK